MTHTEDDKLEPDGKEIPCRISVLDNQVVGCSKSTSGIKSFGSRVHRLSRIDQECDSLGLEGADSCFCLGYQIQLHQEGAALGLTVKGSLKFVCGFLFIDVVLQRFLGFLSGRVITTGYTKKKNSIPGCRMTGAKFDIEKFDGTGDFGLWRIKMRTLLIQHGCEASLGVLYVDMEPQTKAELNKKAHSAVCNASLRKEDVRS
nr:zinc finger, CCHC-type [Tanacetum cinerariifolium]